MDFILNGQAHGGVAGRLLQHNFDVNCLRPFLGRDGRTYITQNVAGKDTAIPVNNTTATLRHEDWRLIDEAVIRVAKPRLRAVGDLRAAGLTYNIPNGMAKTVLSYENVSDINPATISMDGLRRSQSDRPVFDIVNLPLPIIHKDFRFGARELMVSRNSNTPLDTTMIELASRRVAEEAEKLLLGTSSSYAYGGGTVYGYTNFPSRMSKAMTAPTTGGWTPAVLVQQVLAMMQQSRDAYHFGPWMLYNSPAWDQYLDDDYSAAKGDNTLRMRVKLIQGIQDVRTLDYLSGYKMLLVQMSSDVVQEVIGMDMTPVSWEEQGGMDLLFKIMCIFVPRLRCDQNGNTGIVDGTGT